jgi:hypothetical protein
LEDQNKPFKSESVLQLRLLGMILKIPLPLIIGQTENKLSEPGAVQLVNGSDSACQEHLSQTLIPRKFLKFMIEFMYNSIIFEEQNQKANEKDTLSLI